MVWHAGGHLALVTGGSSRQFLIEASMIPCIVRHFPESVGADAVS